MKIYWGITASRSYGNTIPVDESVIISAAGLWTSGRFMKKRIWPWVDWALDSGGFVALNRWGDFPFSPDRYLELVSNLGPEWAASMDYPCEPDIARGTKLSVNDRIEATVEYAVYLCQRDKRIVPVLQGYTAEEYQRCWNLLSSKMSVERLAIGSVCKRQSKAEISTLCWHLRQFLPSIPIHGFGVKLRALEWPEVWELFTSIDTNSWEFHRRGQSWHKIKLTDKQAFDRYYQRIEDIKKKPRQLCLNRQ